MNFIFRVETGTAKQSEQNGKENFSTRQYIISHYVMSRIRTIQIDRK